MFLTKGWGQKAGTSFWQTKKQPRFGVALQVGAVHLMKRLLGIAALASVSVRAIDILNFIYRLFGIAVAVPFDQKEIRQFAGTDDVSHFSSRTGRFRPR